jgi:hypothetical protein
VPSEAMSQSLETTEIPIQLNPAGFVVAFSLASFEEAACDPTGAWNGSTYG